MKRLVMLIVLLILFAANCLAAEKSDQFKLLMIDSQKAEPYITIRKNIISSLKNWGYVQEENLFTKYYSLEHFEGRAKRIWAIESEKQYHVIFINGTMAAIAFKKLGLNHPKHRFVFAAITDPVGVGVIENFSDPPKYNFTGVSYIIPVKKRFKFIRQVMPHAKNIGYIYADMPQSHSYLRWIQNLLKTDPEFKDMKLFLKKVPFVQADMGSKRMAFLSIPFIKELNDQVDLFFSPSDQLGTQMYYSKAVYKYSTKPLLGIAEDDVLQGWGAAMAIFPSMQMMGRQTAAMIKKIFEGEDFKNIIPQHPQETRIAFDLKKAQKLGLFVPPEMIRQAGDNIIK